jgi:hypothetical protein
VTNELSINLRNGDIIPDCEARATKFCSPYPSGDGSYQTYDSVGVPEDNTLRLEEVTLTVAVNSFITGADVAIIQPYLAPISQALSEIPAPASLEDPDERLPWNQLGDLFRSFPKQQFRTPRITKILHKKRPKLIPMVDNVLIDKYFRPLDYTVGYLSEDEKCIELIRMFRTDLLRNISTLTSLQTRLAESGVFVSRVRLLEFLMWNWFDPKQAKVA